MPDRASNSETGKNDEARGLPLQVIPHYSNENGKIKRGGNAMRVETGRHPRERYAVIYESPMLSMSRINTAISARFAASATRFRFRMK